MIESDRDKAHNEDRCSNMLHVVKTKCFKLISKAFAQDQVLLDVVRDIGGSENDISHYWQDDDADMSDLLSWVCTSDDIFMSLIDFVVNPPVASGEKQSSLVSSLKELLLDCGYDLIETSRLNGKPRYKLIEFGTEIAFTENADTTSFDGLFPLGLPVSSNTKPNFKIDSVRGRQKPGFVENNSVGILRGDVYPRFDIVDFMTWCDPEERLAAYISPEFVVDGLRAVQWTIGHNLCTTPSEKLFFKDYLTAFVIPFRTQVDDDTFSLENLVDVVPALIPQVWVRFESYSSNERNRMGYKDERMPYRVDFVAFWNSRRYIIMIDGIEHYAKQGRGGWDADEETYAARLREDRLLRTEGWHVFRLGNWEVKDDTRRKKALEELREFIGFDMPKAPVTIVRPRVKVSPPARVPTSPPRPAPKSVPIARPPVTKQGVQENFRIGEKVLHSTFGEGVVVSNKRVENDIEVTVAFSGKGTKRLLQSFAKLTRPTTRTIDDEDLPF